MSIRIATYYPGRAAAGDANYPGGSFRDVVTPGDGTPLDDAWCNNFLGFFEALISESGIVPSDTPDTAIASDYLDALRLACRYPGTIEPYVFNSIPTGMRMLELNGQGVLRSSYSDLDDSVYVGDGNNPTADSFYHADDAGGSTRNTAGAYLILADMRGRTLRGIDDNDVIDPEGSTRIMGHYQDKRIPRHTHLMDKISGGTLGVFSIHLGTLSGAGSDVMTYFYTGGGSPPTAQIYADAIKTYDGGVWDSGVLSNTDLTPANMACRWGIWY